MEAAKKCLEARSRFGSNWWPISKFQISFFPFFSCFSNLEKFKKTSMGFLIRPRFELGFDLKCKWTTQYQGYTIHFFFYASWFSISVLTLLNKKIG